MLTLYRRYAEHRPDPMYALILLKREREAARETKLFNVLDCGQGPGSRDQGKGQGQGARPDRVADRATYPSACCLICALNASPATNTPEIIAQLAPVLTEVCSHCLTVGSILMFTTSAAALISGKAFTNDSPPFFVDCIYSPTTTTTAAAQQEASRDAVMKARR